MPNTPFSGENPAAGTPSRAAPLPSIFPPHPHWIFALTDALLPVQGPGDGGRSHGAAVPTGLLGQLQPAVSSVQPCPTPLVLQKEGAADTGLAPCRWVLIHWVSPCCHPRYFEEIFNASGTPELVKKYGDWFTYDKNPRAQIFRRNQTLVRDLDSMVRLMRWVLGNPQTWVSPTHP